MLTDTLKKFVIFGIVGLLSFIGLSCKNLDRTAGAGVVEEGLDARSMQGAAGTTAPEGITKQEEFVASSSKKLRSESVGITEPQDIRARVVARTIEFDSSISGCENIRVPPRLSEESKTEEYTFASPSQIRPIAVDTACFPYKLTVSYKCDDLKTCFEGSVNVSIEDYAEIPQELKIPVKVNPTDKESGLRTQEISVNVLPSTDIVRVMDFFNEDCVKLDNSSTQSLKTGARLKILPDCYDSFYKSYSVGGFEYDMFDQGSEETLIKCGKTVKGLETSLDSGDFYVMIKDLYVDGVSYKGKHLNFMELVLSHEVDRKFSVGYQRIENLNGSLKCYRGTKSWEKK